MGDAEKENNMETTRQSTISIKHGQTNRSARVQGKVDEEDLESADGGDRGKVDLHVTTGARICSILTHMP